MRLRLRPSVLLSAVEDGYVAFDTATRRLHHLNPTAALLVELCDGSRGLDDLQAALLPIVGEDHWKLCASWIDEATHDGILDSSDTPSVDERSTSVDALTSLADELRDEGRILEAFICQQRAAELAPQDPDVWYDLGHLAHIAGRRAEARAAYEVYAAHRPDDAEIAHILTALRDEPTPARAPAEYIHQLYSRFASFYDANMTEDLEYRAPALVADAIGRAHGGRNDLRVLDLGCGTGLSGQALRQCARHLVGIDLSANMIARARERGVYDELEVGDIVEWISRPMEASSTPFDLVVACDALIYFGDLHQVLVPAAARLARGGLLAFTVEQCDQRPFGLSDSGRFTHHADHIHAVAREAGLVVVSLEEVVLRTEYGEPVRGLVVVLSRKP